MLVTSTKHDLGNVDKWLSLNKLTPNAKKCESIFFSNSKNLKLCLDKKVNFNGHELENKKSVKYLGVHFDNTLSWKTHINAVTSKINFKLLKIRRLARFLDPVDINMLLNTLVLPYVHYCSTTWATAAPTLINKVQSTINKSLHFSAGIKHIDVKRRLDLDLAILTFKAINKLAPEYINSKLSLIERHHSYNTRQAKNRNIFQTRLHIKMSSQTITSSSSKVWNQLPPFLKCETSLLRFKTNAKKYFLT